MAEKRINGRTFSVVKMDSVSGFRNFIKLTKFIGPGLSSLSDGAGTGEMASMMRGMADIAMAADPDGFTEFVVEMAESAEVKDKAGYRKVVAGHDLDMGELIDVAIFVLQENYADFFREKLGGNLPPAAPETAEAD